VYAFSLDHFATVISLPISCVSPGFIKGELYVSFPLSPLSFPIGFFLRFRLYLDPATVAHFSKCKCDSRTILSPLYVIYADTNRFHPRFQFHVWGWVGLVWCVWGGSSPTPRSTTPTMFSPNYKWFFLLRFFYRFKQLSSIRCLLPQPPHCLLIRVMHPPPLLPFFLDLFDDSSRPLPELSSSIFHPKETHNPAALMRIFPPTTIPPPLYRTLSRTTK